MPQVACTRRTEPRAVPEGGTDPATMPIHASCAALSKPQEAPLPRFAGQLPLGDGGTVWVIAAGTPEPYAKALQPFAEKKPFWTICPGQRGVVVVPGVESEAEVAKFEKLLVSALEGTTVLERLTVHRAEARDFCKDHPCARPL
jgi:hypothetical protein